MSKHSLIKKTMTGVVSAAMIASSVPFIGASTVSAAADPNYAEALELSLYFYDANQCGCEVDDNCLTWRGNCHTYDASASLNSATKLSSSAKSVIQAQNGGASTVDVSGGYHDAGDHVKFSITMAFNAASLNWAYYDHPEAFKDTGTEGHLFYILRETADYFMKTTYLDENGKVAAICHTVADGNVDHGIWTAPETQTYSRDTYWLTSEANNNRICYQMAAALASTAATFKESDSAYAAECLKYADAIYNFSNSYNGNEVGGMSFYSTDASNVPGDKAWAEAWMYVADSNKYSRPTAKPTSDGCYDGSKYDGWIYSWGKVWGGYACLMAEITGDSAYLKEVKYNCDRFSNNNAQKYYIINDWGNSRYNCAWQKYAVTYGELANDKNYLDAAKWQMDFVLGNNPAGYSYLLGYSDKYPTRIHHRAANPDKGASKYTLYGALVGGASDSSGSITDNVDSYAQTEMALDYNACFTLAIAGLYSNYGGDTDSAKKVIEKAPEIDESFDFGGGTIVAPTEYKAIVSVVDAETGEYIPGAGILMETDSANVIWNTSDENPKTVTVTTDYKPGTSYQALVTNMPDGYEFAEGGYYGVSFEDSESAELVIKLKKIGAVPEWGDVNEDGKILIDDVVAVMSYVANPSGTDISEQGLINADVYQTGDGVQASDAASIQKYLIKVIPALPES